MLVPPPGSPPTEIARFVDQLVLEARNDNRRQAWESNAQRCMDLYLGDHWPAVANSEIHIEGGRNTSVAASTAGLIRVILNRVQNIVISLLAIQSNDPPKITFIARETGEKPLIYLNTQLQHPMVQATAAMLGEKATQPLDDAQATKLRQSIELGKIALQNARTMRLPEPEVMPEEALVEVNDHTAAETLQTIFDGMWEECDALSVFNENILNKNIMGWQSTLYEFDPVEKRHMLRNSNHLHVWYDPLASDMANCQYAIHEQPLSAEEAIAAYPDLKKQILERADHGTVKWSGTAAGTSAVYDNRFERHMVAIRTCWLRSWPYPMKKEEALAAGAVMEEEYETQDVELVYDAEIGTHLPQFVKATRLVLADTNEPTDETSPNWPKRNRIRQIRVVADQAVSDQQCPFNDIPLPNNVNTPIPFSMYGQGEPKRLDGLQMAINYVLSSLVTHQRYNAFPAEVRPQAVTDAMPERMRKLRTSPGNPVNIPNHLLERFGDIKKLFGYLEVANMPADAWKLLDFLVNIIDREGNQAEVLSGNASAGWSGEAINSLQNAATAVIKAKSQKTELWLKRLANLMAHSIITLMTPKDWADRCKKYPYQVNLAFHQRNVIMGRDISVQIASGSAASRASETATLIAAKKEGIAVSTPEILERLNLDPDTELQKEARYQQKAAELATPQMQPADPAQQPGAPQPASNNPPAQSAEEAQPQLLAPIDQRQPAGV